MKLTETQKRFREQMAQVDKNKSNIYNYPRAGNSFKIKGGNYTIWIVVGIIFLVVIIDLYRNPILPTSPAGKVTLAPISVSQGIGGTSPTISQGIGGAMPKRYAIFLQKLEEFKPQIDSIAKQISSMHAQPKENRNINRYRNLLIEGITACDNSLRSFEKLEMIDIFEPLLIQREEYLITLSKAYKYYLDFTYSNNKSDNDLGNRYLESANNASQRYLELFKQILDEKSYKYELQPDKITYWYEER